MDNVYEFELTQFDIEILEKNKQNIEQAYRDEILQVDPQYVVQVINWGWCDPKLKKI